MSRTCRYILTALIEIVLFWAFVSFVVQNAHGGTPVVAFDIAQTIPCEDITTDEFTEKYPGERLIEVSFPLSVRTQVAKTNSIDVVEIEIQSMHDRVRVADFVPQTQMASEFVGEIEHKTTVEKSGSIGISAGGAAPVAFGEIVAQITPSANANLGKRTVVTETTKKLPPMKPVLVSGTTSRGQGVFYTIRRNSQTTIEGIHPLSVRFQVPANWKAGQVDISCKASGKEKILFYTQDKTWASARMSVALYLSGDADARKLAESHVDRMTASRD